MHTNHNASWLKGNTKRYGARLSASKSNAINLILRLWLYHFLHTISLWRHKSIHNNTSNQQTPPPWWWSRSPSEMVLCPILWGINYHIFMPVRLDEILNLIVDTRLKFVYVYQKKKHSLYLLFLIMSTLKGDVRVKFFHFTFFCFGHMWKKVNIV